MRTGGSAKPKAFNPFATVSFVEEAPPDYDPAKPLERFSVQIGEARLFGASSVSRGNVKIASVNSSYRVNRENGRTEKSHAATEYQNLVKRSVLLQKKETTRLMKFPVLLRINVVKAARQKKDGGADARGDLDIDNALKATIDGLNGTILMDDRLVRGIVATKSRGAVSSIEIIVYPYSAEAMSNYRGLLSGSSKLKKVFESETELPNGMRIVSFNSMYDRRTNGVSLKDSTKRYKAFLKESHKAARNPWYVPVRGKDVVAEYIFRANGWDLDNKIKAFQDTLQWIAVANDKDVSVIIAEQTARESGRRESISVRIFERLQ